MTSVNSKTSGVIENLDRISQLPEPIILHILSCLPLEDSARASILSKAWKHFCSLHPILYYDHNLFALQSLIGGGGEPPLNQIRDMFLDDVKCHLSRARQLDSPIRKLALKVTINGSECFSRLDKCLELVRHINVEDFCFIVQPELWDYSIAGYSVLYEFPVSVFASKGLRSMKIRGCKFAVETIVGDPINKREVSFSSLQRLCLSRVDIDDHVFENLIKYCQGIEMLVLDYCTVRIDSIELSRFPKLKNAIIEIMRGRVDHVGIIDTHLGCFKCRSNMTECRISRAACASIRELTLVGCTIDQPSLFADLATTFPLLEEADIFIHDTETFKAESNILRKLTFYGFSLVIVKEVYIDCPNLSLLDCCCYDLEELYVDCPKLKVLRYRGNTVPKRLFISSTVDLEESSFKISKNSAYDTLWFINLRALLVPMMASPTYVILSFTLPMTTFEPEKVEALQASPRYNVHLTLRDTYAVERNVAALVDAVLWVIRPTTLVICRRYFYILKYLCENLSKKSQDDICNRQVTDPCWMHQLEDFQVESSSDILDMKDNLVDLPEQCRMLTDNDISDVYFTFLWSCN